MTQAADTANVGAVLGIAQYWSSLVGAFGVMGLIWFVKRWAGELDKRANHLDTCIDGLRTAVEQHHNDTSNRLSVLEEWRRGRDEAIRIQADEYKDYRHHMLAEREIDRVAAHDLRNKVDALGYKIAVLERTHQ